MVKWIELNVFYECFKEKGMVVLYEINLFGEWWNNNDT